MIDSATRAWVDSQLAAGERVVGHCATAIGLLLGTRESECFVENYLASGGALADDHSDHLYWRLLDALAFAPDAEKAAAPWRDLGRADLTPSVLTARLEGYLESLVD